MKPPPLEYRAPSTLEETLELLGELGEEAKLLAGGQSLVPLLAMRLARPAHLIDLNGVDALQGIEDRGATVAIGAMTRERQAERSSLVARRVPALAQALPHVGHPAIRNRGTVGGSLAHADASAELPAVAVLTESTLCLRSRDGQRRIPAADFFLGHFTTALAEDECLVEVEVPSGPEGAGWAFDEVARRHGDFALVGAGAMVLLGPSGRVAQARLCLLGVADRPLRPHAVEAELVGETLDPSTVAAVASEVARTLEPASDLHGGATYRRQLAAVTVRRTLAAAAARAASEAGVPA